MAARNKGAAPKRGPVAKTYKMYVGGKFIRSESGKVLRQVDARGEFVAHTVKASRKDLREAVQCSRGALASWSGRSAFNRSQILARVAEILEDRRALFEESLCTIAGYSAADAAREVEVSIDRMFWYAGWCDKFSQVLGCVNPVAESFFNFTVPEPCGVVVLAAPSKSPLLGLVSALAPILVPGNTCIVLVDHAAPTIACDFSEVIAVSDVPAGVAQVMTGLRADLCSPAASHMDVDAIVSYGSDLAERKLIQENASPSLKRVHLLDDHRRRDWCKGSVQSLREIERCVEWKTAWHPIGV